MATVIKETTAGAVLTDVEILAKELTAATGVTCSGVAVRRGYDLAGAEDVTKDRVEMEFTAAPVDATVDAVIAAHPTILAGLTGTLAVSDGGEYLLHECLVTEGEMVALDCHVACSLGSADDFKSSYLDWYIKADRETGGAIRLKDGSAVALNDISGSKIVAEQSGDVLSVKLYVRRSGNLTLLQNDIEEKIRGRVPA